MSLIRILMQRAGLMMLACLCATMVLALWRAQIDTEREARASAQLAQLVAALSSLQGVSQEALAAQLQSIQQLNSAGGLRHVQLRIRDAQGLDLLVPVPDAVGKEEEAWRWLHPFGQLPQWHIEWKMPRAQGGELTGVLSANPYSEQEEALSGVLGLLAILSLFAALILLGIYLSVRRAFRPLHQILAVIGQIENGGTGQRLSAMSCRELDRIGSALNHLGEALETAQLSRRQLAARIQTLQEDERAQIAMDLHDEFGQQVIGLRANVHWLARQCAGRSDIQAVLAELDHECERMQHGMRDLLQRLRPQGLGEQAPHLNHWLSALIEGWRSKLGPDVKFTLDMALEDVEFGAELAVSLYRLTQEALTNVARHAQAKQVTVRLWHEGDVLHWLVCDDGLGLKDAEPAMLRGRGLAGMRERVWTHGGTLGIEVREGGGTVLQAQFPLSQQAGRA